MNELSERKKKILQAVISDYVKTATPVGSSSVSNQYIKDLSPATIRNEMAELEKAGYITHPHTSAGRIPTDKGYRFYVDHLMKNRPITSKEKVILEEIISNYNYNTENFVKRLLKGLSSLLRYTTIGVIFEDLPKVHWTGMTYLVNQPEFLDFDYLKHLVGALEEEFIIDITKKQLFHHGLTVRIGHENKYRKVNNCTIVIANCNLKNEFCFGIIGPTRMSYDRVFSVFNYLTEELP